MKINIQSQNDILLLFVLDMKITRLETQNNRISATITTTQPQQEEIWQF
jgi:hypothetical protein